MSKRPAKAASQASSLRLNKSTRERSIISWWPTRLDSLIAQRLQALLLTVITEATTMTYETQIKA